MRLMNLLGCFGAVLNACAVWAHGPDAPRHQIAGLGDMTLESGAVVPNVRMSYVTHGKLSPAKDNAILLLHGFGANHHLFDGMIGPGKAFDTDRFFIVATDAFGSTQTGFEHSTSPTTSGQGMRFPQYNGRDMVRAQHTLISKVLGISRLSAVAGISMGAEHSLQFAVTYPDSAARVIPIVGGAYWGTHGLFRLDLLQATLETCDGWRSGQYTENPYKCASNALATLVPYFYTREWWQSNITSPDAYAQWRKGWNAYYLDIQDARDLYYLTRAMAGGIGSTPGFNGDVQAALKSIKARTLFVVSPHDQFFLPSQIEEQRRLIPDARVVSIDSTAGHLICCGGDPQAYWLMDRAIQAFLAEPVRTATR